MRKRDVLVASATMSLLLIGVVIPPNHRAPTPAAHPLNARLMAATRVAQASDGVGYWLVDAKGQVFAFGGAKLYGSMGGKHLKAPITGIVATADNRGYWLVAADGGVFSFGDAQFSGSLGTKSLVSPVVGMASSRSATLNRAQGPAGLTGPAGAQGLAGAIGATGTNGTDGSDGGPGGTGATGAQGAAGLPNYVDVYNLSAQSVGLNSPVNFDSTGPISGFLHFNGAPWIMVDVTGTYHVQYSVSGVEPNQFSLFAGPFLIPNSTYGTGAGTQNTASFDVILNAGDRLQLVNHTSASTVTLQTLAGGSTTNVNASMQIQQIG